MYDAVAVACQREVGRIDGWNVSRQKIAKRYEAGFRGLPLQTPVVPPKSSSIYHLYSVITDQRDRLHEFLNQKAIGSGVYYPLSLHLQPCYRGLGYKPGDLPVSESVSENILSLPMFAEMTAKQINYVIASVREFFGK